MKIQNPKQLAVSIVLCEAAGIIGSIFTSSSIPTWYATLLRPAFGPPNWVFGPVWTTLFALMGIALYLVLQKGIRHKRVKTAVGIFGIQLFLNILWSLFFFGMKNPGAAFGEIIVLWLFIAASIVSFYKISKPAAYLLLPYILWVSFAAYLNYSIWILNS